MNGWIYILLFFVILFAYIHIQHQWKTGEDLEIYEYDYISLKDLQNTCLWKQPILFEMKDFIRDTSSVVPIPTWQVQDIRDAHTNHNHIELISLNESSARGLLDTDTKGVFYSHRNTNILHTQKEWMQLFRQWDTYLKPPFTIQTEYDVWYGSTKTRTTTRYHRESHVFLYVPKETNTTFIRVKMTPYKSIDALQPKDDYLNYEFWSNVDLFALSDKTSSIRCIDFCIKPGYVLFIPSYWFYSIEFQDKRNELCFLKYHTAPNMLANAKYISLYYMQQQNIQEKWWKPITETDMKLLPSSSDHIEIQTSTTSDSTVQLENKSNILREKDPLREIEDNEEKAEIQNVVQNLIQEISTKN